MFDYKCKMPVLKHRNEDVKKKNLLLKDKSKNRMKSYETCKYVCVHCTQILIKSSSLIKYQIFKCKLKRRNFNSIVILHIYPIYICYATTIYSGLRFRIAKV